VSEYISFLSSDELGGRGGKVSEQRTKSIPFYKNRFLDQPLVNDLKKQGSECLWINSRNQQRYEQNQSFTSNSINMVGSLRALVMSPFQKDMEHHKISVLNPYHILQDSQDPVFVVDPLMLNDIITVGDFKKLSNYGVIYLFTHGGRNPSTKEPSIVLSERVTLLKRLKYLALYRDSVVTTTPVLMEFSGSTITFKPHDRIFAITPEFIREHVSNLPNTLVFTSMCYGMNSDALGQAFINAGAGAFVGYNSETGTKYAASIANSVFVDLVSGSTLEEAVDAAIDKIGKYQIFAVGDYKIYSYPKICCSEKSKQLKFGTPSIMDGGFENAFDYWETNYGDVRLVQALANFTPPEGSFMALISSGLGTQVDSDAAIFQRFKVPITATRLKFMYNVISEEPSEFVGSTFDDRFEVTITDSNNTVTQVVYESINTSSWISLPGGQSDGGIFNGGDGTAFHTEWKNVSFDISLFAGQYITLKLRTWDVGDSAFDTAALIDRVLVE
jgi:hypothetical protein